MESFLLPNGAPSMVGVREVRDARLGVVRQLLEFGASTESMSVRADMAEQGQSALLNAARIGQPEVPAAPPLHDRLIFSASALIRKINSGR